LPFPTWRPIGSPLPTTDMFKPMVKNKDHLMSPTHSPSMPKQSTLASPQNPSLLGSTSYSLEPLLFTLTCPKQPTNLMTGVSLQISHATTNWMTTCPVSIQNWSGSMLKWMPSGSPKQSVKGNWSWLVPPSSWHIWSAWQCYSFSRGTSNLPLEGDRRSLRMVVLARVGGNVTGLR